MNKKRLKNLHKVCDYFIALNPKRIDQGNGVFHKDEPCCVGAHLANILTKYRDYEVGIEAFCNLVGASKRQVYWMLEEAGGGNHPFSPFSWDLPVAEVFTNLRKIEKLPSV